MEKLPIALLCGIEKGLSVIVEGRISSECGWVPYEVWLLASGNCKNNIMWL